MKLVEKLKFFLLKNVGVKKKKSIKNADSNLHEIMHFV